MSVRIREIFQGSSLTLTVNQQLVTNERFLESGAHERITGARVDQDSEVDIKEREIYDEWNDNQANRPGRKMSPEMFLGNSICRTTYAD